MPAFTVEYTLTEKRLQRITIEAESAAEALRIIEEYDFDNSGSWDVHNGSLEWSLTDARVVDRDD